VYNSYGSRSVISTDEPEKPGMLTHKGTFAITLRRVYKKSSHAKTVLRLNSQILVDSLRLSIVNCRGSQCRKLFSVSPRIHEPYSLLFHNRQRLQDVGERAEGEGGIYLRLLIGFVKQQLSNTWETLDDIENGRCQTIEFKDVWLLYKPGITVYRKDEDGWRAFKVDSVDIHHLPNVGQLRINAYYLDFDPTGHKLVPFLSVLSLSPYIGYRKISSLDIIPATHFSDRERVNEALLKSGRKLWECHGSASYREYKGNAWPTSLDTVSGSMNRASISKVEPVS
jgi:hypothetical protein